MSPFEPLMVKNRDPDLTIYKKQTFLMVKNKIWCRIYTVSCTHISKMCDQERSRAYANEHFRQSAKVLLEMLMTQVRTPRKSGKIFFLKTLYDLLDQAQCEQCIGIILEESADWARLIIDHSYWAFNRHVDVDLTEE